MERLMRFAAYGPAGIAILLVACCIIGKLVNIPSNRVIWQTCQPEGINYGSFAPYCVAVVEGSVDWQYAFFMEHRRYSIFIGRGKEAPAYGHSVEFSFSFGVATLTPLSRHRKWVERRLDVHCEIRTSAVRPKGNFHRRPAARGQAAALSVQPMSRKVLCQAHNLSCSAPNRVPALASSVAGDVGFCDQLAQ